MKHLMVRRTTMEIIASQYFTSSWDRKKKNIFDWKHVCVSYYGGFVQCSIAYLLVRNWEQFCLPSLSVCATQKPIAFILCKNHYIPKHNTEYSELLSPILSGIICIVTDVLNRIWNGGFFKVGIVVLSVLLLIYSVLNKPFLVNFDLFFVR